MIRTIKYLAVGATFICGCSCTAQKKKDVNYKTIYQREAGDRIQRLNTDSGEVLKFLVLPGDRANNGNRAEIAMKAPHQLRKTFSYSWEFRLNGKYLQTEKNINNHSIIAQWLNPPDYKKGQDFASIKGHQHSPIALRVRSNRGNLVLQILYGLDDVSRGVVKELPLQPDTWYKMEAKVFWSLSDDGFADFDINGNKFRITGKNKYNEVDTDFKVGVYRNPRNTDTTEMLVRRLHIAELQ